MKKSQVSSIIVCLTLLVFSCNPDESLKPSSERNESLSEIDLMIKSGVNLFTREVTLTDQSGESAVVFRAASLSKEVLDNFFRIYEFSISPVSGKTYPKRSSSPYADDQPGEESYDNLDPRTVFTEIKSENLRPGVTGYMLNAKVLDKGFANGRVQDNGYPNRQVHESNTWPEIFKIFAYQTVRYEFDGKSRWYSGWSSRTFCEYYDPSDCRGFWEQPSDNWINVDGPYRVRAVVDFFNYGDYGYCFNCL